MEGGLTARGKHNSVENFFFRLSSFCFSTVWAREEEKGYRDEIFDVA